LSIHLTKINGNILLSSKRLRRNSTCSPSFL